MLTIEKEKLKLFRIRYRISFKEFEKKINSSKKEIFSEWDDYMEWKACINMKKKYEAEKKDIGNRKRITK
ncbi:MAG TPA: hypothetical protein DEH02_14380 [Bacteroidales bacterium]|nr:hypothetical protein [Bacteroidales bacterium]